MLYADSFLAERLYLKGGTAINKLYLGETSRLSIDLDFNHIGPKEQVLKERRSVRERIIELLQKQDASYESKFKPRYEQTTIKSRYPSLFVPVQRFKIEISHIERFPILKPVMKPLQTPDGPESITTYQLEELTATKLRALFERLNGRDIYDLFFISKYNLNSVVTRKMFLYYFYRSKKCFNPKIHYKDLTDRYNSEGVYDDVSGFLKHSVQFSLMEATKHVLSYYTFLTDFDECDEDFLALARLLLGQQIAKKRLPRIKSIKKPLKQLFKDIQISKEAEEILVEDIKHFQASKTC